MNEERKSVSALEMINTLYDDETLVKKKAKAFDDIAKMYYDKNFGTTTKSEIELLMFSIYMDTLIDKHSDNDGFLDYKICSDFIMGKQLGIPQEKVRTLKIKKQARYPKSFDWRISLEKIKSRIVYDEGKDRIIIPMSDPNLYNEIRNFIEEHDGYIEIQRGNNVLQMKPEYFFMLLYTAVENENDKEKIRKSFVKQLREKNEDNNISDIHTDRELQQIALEKSDNFFEMAKIIAKGVENPLVGIITAIQCISKTVRK